MHARHGGPHALACSEFAEPDAVTFEQFSEPVCDIYMDAGTAHSFPFTLWGSWGAKCR